MIYEQLQLPLRWSRPCPICKAEIFFKGKNAYYNMMYSKSKSCKQCYMKARVKDDLYGIWQTPDGYWHRICPKCNQTVTYKGKTPKVSVLGGARKKSLCFACAKKQQIGRKRPDRTREAIAASLVKVIDMPIIAPLHCTVEYIGEPYAKSKRLDGRMRDAQDVIMFQEIKVQCPHCKAIRQRKMLAEWTSVQCWNCHRMIELPSK